MDISNITVNHLGQVDEGNIQFGDLSVFVGPQATGKSIFLQLLKLLIDTGPIIRELRRFNIDWGGKLENFMEIYFGEGMSPIYVPDRTRITVDGQFIDLPSLFRGKKRKDEKLFYIPAQRVLSLREGLTRPFTDYRSGDPFVVREFSEKLHHLIQAEFSRTSELFPKSNRLKEGFRKRIAEHIFGEFGLKTSSDKFQKRIVLSSPSSGASLPYLVWSAGQREFVPLLLGLYWLMPSSKVTRRAKLEWVVIEELEMGLHPSAISVAMLMVLELLSRGYRVCLSTHSPHVLDVMWALRIIKERKGTEKDVLDLFELPTSLPMKVLVSNVLGKDLKAYFFQPDGKVVDISRLDPGVDNEAEANWGGLAEFSGHVGDIVSRVVSRAQEETLP